MSEIQTSLDFRQFSCVPFPDSLEFGRSVFRHSLYVPLIEVPGARALVSSPRDSTRLICNQDKGTISNKMFICLGTRAGPFNLRPFLTMDFTSNLELRDNSTYGPLSCVPVHSQEVAIVQDLLYCFIGIPGIHIW